MGFPYVVASGTLNQSTAANPTPIPLPTGYVPGDLLIVRLRSTAAGAWTNPAGWTEFFTNAHLDASSGDRDYMGYKIAGADGSTLNVTNAGAVKAAAISVAIRGWHGVTVPAMSTVAIGTTATPDPSSLSPSWGADDTLWLWVGGWEGRQTTPPATPPANYTFIAAADTGTATNDASNCRLAMYYRQIAGASEDPPSVTISLAAPGWAAHTVGVRPALIRVRNPMPVFIAQ